MAGGGLRLGAIVREIELWMFDSPAHPSCNIKSNYGRCGTKCQLMDGIALARRTYNALVQAAYTEKRSCLN